MENVQQQSKRWYPFCRPVVVYERCHRAQVMPCCSDTFSLFVAAGEFDPAMLVIAE